MASLIGGAIPQVGSTIRRNPNYGRARVCEVQGRGEMREESRLICTALYQTQPGTAIGGATP